MQLGHTQTLDTGRGSPNLITQAINERNLVPLRGNTRPEANPQNDRGAVADELPMTHMLLQLRRPPEQETALEQFLNELQDPQSANFHRWLSPQQFGQNFGLAQQDLDVVTQWLQSHGFNVNFVYPSRMLIDFSGTAGQVREGLHTEIHHFEVRGEPHIANVNDPQIPAALAPVIVGVVSLNDFKPHALHEMRKPGANYTFPGSLGTATYAVVPADLATIYNLNPLFSSGITGQGQTIVLIEDTNVFKSSDWTTFRSKFGLSKYSSASFSTVHPAPLNGPNNCANPGVVPPNDAEAILDAEWASAAAPSATILMASCADSTTTFGGLIALQNLINASTPPPALVSISYGQCETENGAPSNAAYNSTYQQAVAEGVSVFVAAGDSGASGCDDSAAQATHGIGVNAFASTPYNVAVGGTDFSDTYSGTNSIYWGSTNTSTFGSALSYIPEIPWNDSCAGQLVSNFEGYTTPYGSNGFCNSDAGGQLQTTVAGGGGPSACATGAPSVAGVVSGTCAGWPKPSWQSVLNNFGNPNDGVRDTPDVSLFAANGLWTHYYVFCWSDTANGGAACSGAPSGWSGAGGTSFSSPIMAGIQALVNQKTGQRQGNPNPVYYQFAANEYNLSSSSCNSANGNSVSAACVFYDVTQGDMDVNCTGSNNCYLPSGTQGVLSTQDNSYLPSYASTTGWDFATGIGSVNAANLVNNWPTASSSPVLMITKTHTGSFVQGQQHAIYTVTVSNSAIAGPTNGTVTVTETQPSGLMLVSMAGMGWTCATNTCTRSDVLNRGGSYPAITVTVNVAANATSPQVNQVSVSGGGSATASATDSTTIIVTPAAPTGLLATAYNAEISLSWNSSSGATSYNVLRSTTGGGPYTTIASGVTSTSFTDTGVTNNTTYYYVVQAVNAAGTSPNSNQASATPSVLLSWQNGYAYRRAITIDHTKVPNSDQLNFPVLISGTYSYLASIANGGNVTNANGYDIVFTSDAGGNSPLPYERESYSASTGAVDFWVQVPVVSHTSDTVIYLFYDNPSVSTDQTNGAGTWDSNFKAVWHLPNGTSLSGADSTTNAVNGSNAGLTAIAGLIDGAASGDGGAGHQINTANNPYPSSLFSSNGLTLSAWVKPVANSSTSQVVSLEGAYVIDVSAGRAGFEINGTGSDLVSAAAVPNGSWTHIVGTSDSSGNLKLYVNGALSNSASQIFYNLDSLTRPYSVGGHPVFSQYNFNGIIDEVRISNMARSADWIAAEYANQSGSYAFYTIGAAGTSGGLPFVPSGLSAAAGNGQVSLSWNSSSGATSYNVLRSTTSGGPYTTIASGVTSTSYTDTGVTNSTTYYYVVQAVNATGTSPNSNQASATPCAPPAAPTGLSATAFNAQVSLTWNASSAATGYNVLRSTTGGGPYTTIASGVTATSYSDSGLTNGTTYYYVVAAVSACGQGPNSNQASATPSVLLSWQNGYAYRRAITIDHTKVPNSDQLNFPVLISGTYSYLASIANGGNVTNANGYDIVFTSDAGGNSPLPYERESYSASTGAVDFWVQVPVVSHTSDTVIYLFYDNPSVSSDQTNGAGTWDSNFKAVWHLPNGTSLSGADSTTNAVNGSNAGLTAIAGLIDGAASGDGGAGHQINTANNPYPSSLFSSNGLTLSAWVKPVANSSTSQVVSLEGAYVIDVSAGRAGFEINGTGSDLVSAAAVPNGSWTHIVGTSDSSGNLKLYVNGALSNSASQIFYNLDSLTRPYSVGGHPVFSQYNFNGIIDEVRISNMARSADWIAAEYANQSGSYAFYTIGAAGTSGGLPFVPSGLSAAAGNGQVSLSWNSSSGATSYNVLRSTTSGGPYTTIASGVTSTSYTDTGVTNSTTYYYVVQAVNATGTSPNSNQASATPCAPPAAPTGLSATAFNAQVSLTWNASSAATGYNVLRSTTGGGPYTTIASGVTSTSYSDSGLTNGTTYYYVVAAVSACGQGPNSNQASATPSVLLSWQNGYAYRRAITIDHTKVPNSDQLNFPVLISGTYSYLASIANGGNVTNANGYDIAFTSDAGGNSPLPYERESYSASTGAVDFWVQVPVVSHTSDTVIYLFYDNPSVSTDQTNGAGTWDSNFKAVWHLPNGTSSFRSGLHLQRGEREQRGPDRHRRIDRRSSVGRWRSGSSDQHGQQSLPEQPVQQ